jgi:hypothetical protein
MEETSTTPAFVPLTFEQVRVLGCLLEKEATTPDYYPMTLNGLTTACNQSTNREPVVAFSEETVTEALEGLKVRQFALQVTLAGSRVQKFKHNMDRKLPWLEKPQIAVLCVLMLRGAQTLGELRQRTERLYTFPDLASLEATLQTMITGDGNEPTVVLFPPGPGRKSPLYVHTLAGVPDAPSIQGGSVMTESFAPSASVREDDQLWRARIEGEIADLRAQLADLKAKLGEI